MNYTQSHTHSHSKSCLSSVNCQTNSLSLSDAEMANKSESVLNSKLFFRLLSLYICFSHPHNDIIPGLDFCVSMATNFENLKAFPSQVEERERKRKREGERDGHHGGNRNEVDTPWGKAIKRKG